MINATGSYSVSLDGGVTYKEVSNLILSGYYKSQSGKQVRLSVGSSDAPVLFDDSSVSTLSVSDVFNGLADGAGVFVGDSHFEIDKSRVFSFGTGHDFRAKEVGLTSGGDLISRALLSDGGVYVIQEDDLKIKYSIKYKIPRQGFRVQVDFLGVIEMATVYFVNPRIWTGNGLGMPVSINSAAICTGASISPGAELEGGILKAQPVTGLTSSESLGYDKKSYTAGFFSGLGELNGTFNQVIFCKGSASSSSAVVFLEFDNELTKSSNDTFSMSVSITQERPSDPQ